MTTPTRADIFPAVIAVAPADEPAANSLHPPDPETSPKTRLIDRARIVVTLDAVYIFKDSANGPALVFYERLADYTPPSQQPKVTGSIARRALTPPQATLVTDSGKTLAFHRSSGCGCGSRLRTFDPFQGIQQAASYNDR